MGLIDMLSGRNSRRNHIERITFTEPMARIAQLELRGFLKDYTMALAAAVGGLVESFVDEKESSIPAYAEIGKNAARNTGAIQRLAAYCAHWLQNRFLADNPTIFLNEAGQEDETSLMIRRDLENIEPAMYPVNDPLVTNAISLLGRPPIFSPREHQKWRLVM